jgi:hypothetical protein
MMLDVPFHPGHLELLLQSQLKDFSSSLRKIENRKQRAY